MYVLHTGLCTFAQHLIFRQDHFGLLVWIFHQEQRPPADCVQLLYLKIKQIFKKIKTLKTITSALVWLCMDLYLLITISQSWDTNAGQHEILRVKADFWNITRNSCIQDPRRSQKPFAWLTKQACSTWLAG